MARRSLSKEIEDIREKLGNHSIVLVGLMGAGKSSIGRRLAEKLDVPLSMPIMKLRLPPTRPSLKFSRTMAKPIFVKASAA